MQDMLAGGIRIDTGSIWAAGSENGGDHYAPAMELLNMGIMVLGERPSSNEIVQAEDMVALANRGNVRYGINLNHRFAPAALRATERVTLGRLGEIHTVNMPMWFDNPHRNVAIVPRPRSASPFH